MKLREEHRRRGDALRQILETATGPTDAIIRELAEKGLK